MDRGALNKPTYNTCQWSIFCFLMLLKRKTFCSICMVVSEYYDFEMEKRHGLILSKSLFKKLAKVASPRLEKVPALNILNLS